jgi:hypothetical protein
MTHDSPLGPRREVQEAWLGGATRPHRRLFEEGIQPEQLATNKRNPQGTSSPSRAAGVTWACGKQRKPVAGQPDTLSHRQSPSSSSLAGLRALFQLSRERDFQANSAPVSLCAPLAGRMPSHAQARAHMSTHEHHQGRPPRQARLPHLVITQVLGPCHTLARGLERVDAVAATA